MKVQSLTQFTNIGDLSDLTRKLTQFAQETANVINGNLTLSDNVDAQVITAEFTVANTQASFSHTLGRVPRGYIPVALTANMVIYDGTIKNDINKLYLRASVAGTAKLWVF